MRSGEYVLPKPVIKPFHELEKFYIEKVIGSASWKFVRRQDPNSSQTGDYQMLCFVRHLRDVVLRIGDQQ